MKKILFAIGLGLVTTVANAQNWQPQSFLNDGITALVISNAIAGVAGAKGVTNLQSTTAQGGIGPGTNIAGTTYWVKLSDIGSNSLQTSVVSNLPPWMTNALYTNYVVGILDPTTNAFAASTSLRNLLDPMVSLWTDRNAVSLPINYTQTGSNCFASIMVRTVGGALATNALTIVVEGVPWADKDGNTIGTTGTQDRFIFQTATNNANTVQVLVTNIPIQRFIGYKGLRVGSITLLNPDNNAGNQIYLTHLHMIGFIP